MDRHPQSPPDRRPTSRRTKPNPADFGVVFTIHKEDASVRVQITERSGDLEDLSDAGGILFQSADDAVRLFAMLGSARVAGYRYRNVKPRCTERDAEIGRLHGEGRKPKEIWKLITSDPRWMRNQKGGPLKLVAVYSVIRRLKQSTG
jgi:hypothetical protein